MRKKQTQTTQRTAVRKTQSGTRKSAQKKSETTALAGFDTRAMLHDFLSTQKMVTGNYNTFAGECMHSDLRSDVLSILQEEHSIQNEIFEEMKQNGWYPVKAATQAQITTAKKKFSIKQ